jgi:hypothetical protein
VDGTDRFALGFDYARVIAILSKEIYDDPRAFLRENVQNAIDAVRIQAVRDGADSADPHYAIAVTITGDMCVVTDNGIGMSSDDQRRLFWTMGSSGKDNAEARTAGCIGSFGIGGLANLGVCLWFRVDSRPEGAADVSWSHFARDDFQSLAVGEVPQVSMGTYAMPTFGRGTVLSGRLERSAQVEELIGYLKDVTQYTPEAVSINEALVSQRPFKDAVLDKAVEEVAQPTEPLRAGLLAAGLRSISRTYAAPPSVSLVSVNCAWSRDESRRLYCEISGGDTEAGDVDVLRRGFKICRAPGRYPENYAYSVPDFLGVSGIIDCDRLAPTAGRGELDKASELLLAAMLRSIINQALAVVVSDADLVAENPTAMSHALRIGCVEALDNVRVELVGGDQVTLAELRTRAARGITVYFARHGYDETLAHLLQARGASVVRLPADRRASVPTAEYLTTFCKATSCEGKVECIEPYDKEGFSPFERMFVYELESILRNTYHLYSLKVIFGRLTRDVPVYVASSEGDEVTILLNVRHDEIVKFRDVPYSLAKTVVRSFCFEFLGGELKKVSPRFFGSGSIDLDWLRERQEQWLLFAEETLTLRAPDIAVVSPGSPLPSFPAGQEPKLFQFVDAGQLSRFSGYYLRLPDGPVGAFRDDILVLDELTAVWISNKITFVVADGFATAFEFQLRLDQIIGRTAGVSPNGMIDVVRQIYEIYNGLYFPVPTELEHVLVPKPNAHVKIIVSYEHYNPVSA